MLACKRLITYEAVEALNATEEASASEVSLVPLDADLLIKVPRRSRYLCSLL